MRFKIAQPLLFCLIFSPLSAQALELATARDIQPPLESNTITDITLPHETAPIAPTLLQQQVLRMHAELTYYLNLAETAQWDRIGHGPLLKEGDKHPQVIQLRERLLQLGDLDNGQNCQVNRDSTFDSHLTQALQRFQLRHGAKIDGVLGPQTRRLLNIRPEKRAEQIGVNLSRIEAFQPNTDRYILVNIPEYKLRLFEQGRSILKMKTIVGRKKRKTPVFDTQINRIVVNPSWHVPKSIAYKDIIPALKEDPDYLKKTNLQIVTGWGKGKKFIPTEELDYDKFYKGSNYQRIWGPPSKSNALGSVKFLTDDHRSIYLHDTNAKGLFEKNNRAFSSGCIRVEQPRKLADELMRMTRGWDELKLDPIFERSETHQINLPDPIPLHVTYWTAFVDEEGFMNFRNDPYRFDSYELSKLKQ